MNLKTVKYEVIDCGISLTKTKTIKVIGWHKVPTYNKVRCVKWLDIMKRAPLYPSDKKFCICSLHFADFCFKGDLKVHAIVAISFKFAILPVSF